MFHPNLQFEYMSDNVLAIAWNLRALLRFLGAGHAPVYVKTARGIMALALCCTNREVRQNQRVAGWNFAIYEHTSAS